MEIVCTSAKQCIPQNEKSRYTGSNKGLSTPEALKNTEKILHFSQIKIIYEKAAEAGGSVNVVCDTDESGEGGGRKTKSGENTSTECFQGLQGALLYQ